MNATTLVSRIEAVVRAAPPPGVEVEDIEAFLARHRGSLVELVEVALRRRERPLRTLLPRAVPDAPEDLVFRVVQDGVGYLDVSEATGTVEQSCASAARRLGSRVGEPMRGVLTVTAVHVDPRKTGRGLGLGLYRTALKHAARRGYALTPHACLTHGSTSEAARAIWKRLKAEAVHEGDVVWGGPAPSEPPPPPPAPVRGGVPTRWGGRREFAPLARTDAQPGRRIVLDSGEHGVVLSVTPMLTRGAGGPDEKWAQVDLELDSGRLTVVRHTRLFAETAPPTRVVPDVLVGGVYHDPTYVWTRVVSNWEDVGHFSVQAAQARGPERRRRAQEEVDRSRTRALSFFRAFHTWRQAWPDEPVEGLDPDLYRRLQLQATSPEAAELAELSRLLTSSAS